MIAQKPARLSKARILKVAAFRILFEQGPENQSGIKLGRRNWWQGLIGYLERGLEYDDIPKEFEEEIEAFVEYYRSEKFHRQSLTTSDDISCANSLLDKILGGTE